jgi:MFS superfamily sulfate permease-like transporter
MSQNLLSRDTLGSDLSAGLVVFLVALPLCLGIALASGAPLFAGVISGVVAGVVVAWLSGSEVSVSGPAAGLTVTVAAGIAATGSYETFLCAVVFAGAVQILLGVIRAGSIASLMPNSVITGLLTAIGVIIVLKQIPHALGRDSDYEGDMNFWQITDQENTFSEIMKAVYSFSPGVVIISTISIAVLLSWTAIGKRFPKLALFFPGPLAAVIAGTVCNEVFKLFFPDFYASAADGHLVVLPVAASASEFFGQFIFPSFDTSKLGVIASTGLGLAIIASIETLLCLEAGDKIDPYRRTSNGNRELFAQGIGNMICGLIGGLPMTSVVVRTSANVYAGARTRLSAVVHGLLLLAAVTLIPYLLNRIPLGTLAAVLLVIGYKLASFDLFKRMYQRGVDQFVPFMVTVVAIVFTDILTGVFAGVVVSMVFVVKSNYHSAITLVNEDNRYLVRFTKDVSFINKISLKKILATVPDQSSIVIDGRQAIFIDKDIFEVIEDFKKNAAYRGIKIETQNLESKSLKLFGAAD